MSYSPDYFTARESWRDWRIEARMLLTLARVSRGTRVLDLGCGGGGLVRLASACGALAIGADTLEVALNLARQREREYATHAAGFVQITGDGRLPWRDRTFDAILAQHVIEHIDDIAVALGEWARILKPGGRLALATPNAHYPDPAHFADDDHAHIFSPAELSAMFTRAGWRVEICRTIFPYLAPGRFARAFGVIAYRVFARAPYWAWHGRTIVLAAQPHRN